MATAARVFTGIGVIGAADGNALGGSLRRTKRSLSDQCLETWVAAYCGSHDPQGRRSTGEQYAAMGEAAIVVRARIATYQLRIAREDPMNSESILIWLVVGAVAGWLAGQFIKGGGFGLIGNIVVGIIGSVIAGYLLPLIGVQLGTGFVRSVINAFIGACLLLTIVRLVRR